MAQPTAPKVIDPVERETIQYASVETRSELKCETCQLKTSIFRLGEIAEMPIYVPRYATCHTPIVATGKQGIAPGELACPSGVVIHENTHQIFVANGNNDRVEIFSETGEFLSQLGVGQPSDPRQTGD